MESKLEDGQCGFRPGRSTIDHIFTLKQIFEKSWEYGKDLFASFVDLEKAYDWVPPNKLWKVLRKYGVDGQLLRAIKSFYCRPEFCVRVNGKQLKPFHVGVGSGKGEFGHLSFSLFAWIGSTNAAKLMNVPQLKIAKSVVCSSMMIRFCFLSQNLVYNAHLISLQMQATPPEWK